MRARHVTEAVELRHVDPRAHDPLQPKSQPPQRRRDIADRLPRLYVDLSTADQLPVLVEAGTPETATQSPALTARE